MLVFDRKQQNSLKQLSFKYIYKEFKKKKKESCFLFSVSFCSSMSGTTHSSVLAWRIPGTGEPVYGVAQSWTWLKQLSSGSNARKDLPYIERKMHSWILLKSHVSTWWGDSKREIFQTFFIWSPYVIKVIITEDHLMCFVIIKNLVTNLQQAYLYVLGKLSAYVICFISRKSLVSGNR